MAYNIIVGTRPNFVKLSALMREAKKHRDISFRVIHTGQHYDDSMSRIFFDELELPEPDVILPNAHLGEMVANLRTHIGFEPVIVFGDTRSALAGALATGNRLIHIEAGLRSFDSRMPEETNRIVIDRLSDQLFTSEQSANDNLLNEGFDKKDIFYVGNLMLETLEHFHPVISKEKKGGHIVATIHRFENEAHLKQILFLLAEMKDVILVAHPGTMAKIKDSGLSLYGIGALPPMGYVDFMKLVYSSRGVITDSGGLQEECAFLGVKCATLRDNTERPSTLEFGVNRLFPLKDLDAGKIRAHLESKGIGHKNDFPDNRVAERIFEHL